MRIPPTMWFAVSSAPARPSQRKVREASAYASEPRMIPATAAMPNVRPRDLSLHSSRSSSEYAAGEIVAQLLK